MTAELRVQVSERDRVIAQLTGQLRELEEANRSYRARLDRQAADPEEVLASAGYQDEITEPWTEAF